MLTEKEQIKNILKVDKKPQIIHCEYCCRDYERQIYYQYHVYTKKHLHRVENNIRSERTYFWHSNPKINYIQNKQIINERAKEYYRNNKEKVLSNMKKLKEQKQKYHCVTCDKHYAHHSLYKHLESKKHLKKLNTINTQKEEEPNKKIDIMEFVKEMKEFFEKETKEELANKLNTEEPENNLSETNI